MVLSGLTITLKVKKMPKHEYDGYIFDSKLELNHYQILKEAPDIEILAVHKTYLILPKRRFVKFPSMKSSLQREIKYTPDFVVKIANIDKPVVFESKGYPRKDYMIRKKLFIDQYDHQYYFYECGSVKQLYQDLETIRGGNL